MLRFDIITIFPEVFSEYLNTSILVRAQKKRRVNFSVHDLRKWAKDTHRTVDDKPYGGGPGMVMKVEPIHRAVNALTARNPKSEARNSKQIRNSKSKTRVVLFSASGKQFTQRVAEQYTKRYDRIILICGRYEGVDARVAEYIADEELSVGPYVLTGGELPAMVVADAVTRLLPGVLGNEESLREESFGFKEARLRRVETRLRRGAQFRSRGEAAGEIGEYPQYTRPEIFHPFSKSKRVSWRVPKVLLSGDHKKIMKWRHEHLK